MRLQLIALAVLGADGTFATKVQLYTDNDLTVVVSPRVRAGATTSSGTSAEVSYSEDVVSSASVDVRSTASPRIHDVRQEVDLSLGQDVAGILFGAALVHATEKDYLSNGASLSLSRELNEKNTALALRAGFTANVVGKAGDPLYQAPMNDASADLGLTQTLSPRAIGQLSVTLARQQGQIASPYRKVAAGAFVLPEVDPDVRDRVAASVGAKRAFGDLGVGHADYRFYWDSFSIVSHTVEARWTFEWDQLALRLRYRFYSQTGASFYRSRYDQPLKYLSADREMSPFLSHLFGAKLEWSPPRNDRAASLRFDAKVEGMYFDYRDFPALKSRAALEVQVGAAVDF